MASICLDTCFAAATPSVCPSPATPTQAAAAGTYKCNLPWWKIVLLGCVAGCYVGLGGALLLTGALADGLELQPKLGAA